MKTMNVQGNETILDIGAGSGALWSNFCTRRNIEHLNLIGMDIKRSASNVYKQFIIGDARALPLSDKSIDIVFSNSVLEHVGNLEQQKRMASEVTRVGKKYFVQVPNKHFPIEPHYFIPFLQYFPLKVQKMITSFLFGEFEEIHLPTLKHLKSLFPNAKIAREKIFGLTKSFYVYHD